MREIIWGFQEVNSRWNFVRYRIQSISVQGRYVSFENIRLSYVIDICSGREKFVHCFRRKTMYMLCIDPLYTLVNNESIHLWWMAISKEDLKRSWKSSLLFFNNKRKDRPAVIVYWFLFPWKSIPSRRSEET